MLFSFHLALHYDMRFSIYYHNPPQPNHNLRQIHVISFAKANVVLKRSTLHDTSLFNSNLSIRVFKALRLIL